MKTKIFLVFLMTISASTILAQTSIDHLIKERKALQSLILSDPENKQSVRAIIRLQREINEIEQENGISKLQNQLAKLRLDSCRLQQENTEAREALNDVSQISLKIREITRSEREEVDKLTEQQSRLRADSPEAKELEDQLSTIQERMQTKSDEYVKQIKKLNNRIYKQLPDQMQAGKQAAIELKEKYLKIKDEIDPLDQEIAQEVKAIHRRLENEQDEMKKLRESIRQSRKKISTENPCFAAQLSAKSEHWLDRFS